MITAVVLDWIEYLVVGPLLSLFPEWPVPSWLSGGSTQVAVVVQKAMELSNWIPLEVGGWVIATVLGSLTVGVAIKIARIVASFFTAGGGSAA